MFLRNLNPFYSPDDNPTATIESGKMSVSDMAEFLAKDEPLELDEDTKTDEEDSDKTDKEEEEEKGEKKTTLEDELEEDLNEEDDEKVDEDEVVMPVRRKEVLAKYPNIFKEFPHLDQAVYREQKYSEIVPTLKDARIAVDKAEVLDNFSKELSEGKVTTILQAVKDEDPDAFYSIVDNYMSQLHEVEPAAYFHVLGNMIKHTVVAMHKSDDEDTKTAAALLYKFVFNSDKYEPPTNLSKKSTEKDERETQIEEREQNFRKQQLDSHVNTVNTRIDNSIKAAIDKNIDPRESMNDYVKEKAIKDCIDSLDNNIKKDTRFQNILDKLWEKASESNFSQESLDRIRNAYLSKAKGLLPEIIRKTRQTALRGQGSKSPNERTNPLPVGRPNSGKKTEERSSRSSGQSDKDKAQALPKGTKSLDYLMRD